METVFKLTDIIDKINDDIKWVIRNFNERISVYSGSGYLAVMATKEELEFLMEAREVYERSIVNPSIDRQHIAQDYIGDDPYCWSVIPYFHELEEGGAEEITIVWPDGSSYHADLNY
jgi:hypothetical protein